MNDKDKRVMLMLLLTIGLFAAPLPSIAAALMR